MIQRPTNGNYNSILVLRNARVCILTQVYRYNERTVWGNTDDIRPESGRTTTQTTCPRSTRVRCRNSSGNRRDRYEGDVDANMLPDIDEGSIGKLSRSIRLGIFCSDRGFDEIEEEGWVDMDDDGMLYKIEAKKKS